MANHDDIMSGWVRSTFTSGGLERDVYRRGNGPGIIVVHEIPGITPLVAKFANELVERGFTVAMPDLVGTPGRAPSPAYLAASMLRVCVSREFTTMALGRTSPIIAWLRALGRSLHADVGGPGIGAIGMCFSGGFALGMMVDDHVVAPVLSQPSLPFSIGRARAGDLNLSPDDERIVVRRAQEGCQVLGLRFTGDKLVGTRFETLRNLLGDAFVAVEFPSSKPSDHSVLTEQRQEDGVRQVIEFFEKKLASPAI